MTYYKTRYLLVVEAGFKTEIFIETINGTGAQCDQMAGLLVQYLPIYNYESLWPIAQKITKVG